MLAAMSTAADFLNAHGPPRKAAPVSEADIEAARGRLPDDLLQLWRRHGIGSYARGQYWLCHPALFDAALDALLANVPDLPGQLAAFGYRSTGQVDLWHRAGRHFCLLLPFGVIDDATSRTETAPVPYDLVETLRQAGVEMTLAEAEATFRASRMTPANIWMVLSGASSGDGYLHDIGADGRSLPAALKRLHGPLGRDEIYCRRTGPEGVDNLAPSYERLPLPDVFRRLPPTVTLTRSIEGEAFPEIVIEEFPAGTSLRL